MTPTRFLQIGSALAAIHLVFGISGMACAQSPEMIAYQGRVAVDGVNFHGQG